MKINRLLDYKLNLDYHMEDMNFELFIKYLSKKKLKEFGANDVRRSSIYETYSYEIFGALNNILSKEEVPENERLSFEEFDNIDNLKIIKHLLVVFLNIKKADYNDFIEFKRQTVIVPVFNRNELLGLTMSQLATMVATRAGLYKWLK